MYVAAYGYQRSQGVTYMNIEFPLAWGAMTSVLRPVALHQGALELTTRRGGVAGIYLNGMRLPLHETIRVGANLVARHEVAVWRPVVDARL